MLCEDYAEIVDEEDADYSSPTRDFELDRSRVDLTEIIGEGQFGDVYRGVYTPASAGLESVPVAVKTCKIDQDGSMADKFLEEACKFEESSKGSFLNDVTHIWAFLDVSQPDGCELFLYNLLFIIVQIY